MSTLTIYDLSDLHSGQVRIDHQAHEHGMSSFYLFDQSFVNVPEESFPW